MIRTQIQLEERQAAALRKAAAAEGVSMAELIRRAVDESLLRRGDGTARYRRALLVIGKGRSGKSDISSRHDEYFAEHADER